MGALMDIGERSGVKIIEDAAQAHGAEYRGRRVGTFGDAGCFSFFPSKNLGAYGDGGMVTTNDPEVADRARRLRDHGRGDKYTHLHVGMGERLDTIQAAILRVKLRRLNEWTEARRGVADSYNRLLKESGLGLPQVTPDSTHVYHLYVVRVPLRDQVLGLMQKNGVSVGVHYPIPVHLQPGYRFLGYRKGDFPNAERAAEEVLSLPMYPELQPGQITTVVGALSDALRLPGGP